MRDNKRLIIAAVVTLLTVLAVGLLVGYFISSVASVHIGPEHFNLPVS